MSFPFVAGIDYGLRKGPVLGFVIHFAEGGNTVNYLRASNNPPRGVSVHYVLDVHGDVTQMVRESHASGSINPQELRTGNDADGFYGVSAGKAVLGSWYRDPNSAVISLEIEGFAIQGPSPIQKTMLARLVADVRSRYPGIGLLGHRDFTTTKQCPGRLIPWAELGGHGPAQGESSVAAISTSGLTLSSDYELTIPSGSEVHEDAVAGSPLLGTYGGTFDYFGASGAFKAIRVSAATGSKIGFTASAATPVKKAAVPVDCKAAVNAALDHVLAPLGAVATAITEARPR